MIIFVGVIVLTVVCLGCCWYLDEVSLQTKLVFTTLYAASWGLFFLPLPYHYLFTIAQMALVIVIGVKTFGLDWLIGR